MKESKFNLQILHHEDVFKNSEEAFNYLTDYYKPQSLEAEPVLLKYGDERNPDVILAFGTSNAAPGSFYAIDFTSLTNDVNELKVKIDGDSGEMPKVAETLEGIIKSTGLFVDENKINDKISYEPDNKDEIIGSAVSIANAIQLLSEYVQQKFNDNGIVVEDTKSVRLLYEVNSEGGKTLKAEVNVSESGNSDDLGFNNNIIGIKNDGLYAASHLAYDEVRHQLIFTTSGYKNGSYQDDAIVQKINLGEKTKITVDNSEKPVKLTVVEENSNFKLSADVDITEREDNILQKVDGKLYVQGRAKNIKYKDSTVAKALNEISEKNKEIEQSIKDAVAQSIIEGDETDTSNVTVIKRNGGNTVIRNDVRLGTNQSIIVKNGGLEADVTFDVDVLTNTLTLKVGKQTYVKTLPGVDLIESSTYSDAEGIIYIKFKGNPAPLMIPVGDIVHSWDTLNIETSPVVLKKTIISGGTDTLSADIKLRSTDNIIGKDMMGQLYVSPSEIEATINNKMSVTNDKVSELENKLNNEIERSTVADGAINDKANQLTYRIDELKSEVDKKVENISIEKVSPIKYSVFANERRVGDIDIPETGQGLELNNEKFTIKKDSESEDYLKVSENGVAIKGIDEALSDKANKNETYTKQEVDNLIPDVSVFATKSELDVTNNNVSQNKSDIDELKEKIKEVNIVTDETDTLRLTLESNEGTEHKTIKGDVKIKGDAANIIKKDASGIFANVTLEYDKITNRLTFKNGVTEDEIQLSAPSGIKSGYYDKDRKVIVFELTEGDPIEINASDLITLLQADNTDEDKVIELTIDTIDNIDKISGDVRIVDNDDNILKKNGNALFVSGKAEDHTAIYGGEKKSLQGVINALSEAQQTANTSINQLNDRISALETEVSSIKETLQSINETLNNLIDFETYG